MSSETAGINDRMLTFHRRHCSNRCVNGLSASSKYVVASSECGAERGGVFSALFRCCAFAAYGAGTAMDDERELAGLGGLAIRTE